MDEKCRSFFRNKTFDEVCVGTLVRGKMSSQCPGVNKIFVKIDKTLRSLKLKPALRNMSFMSAFKSCYRPCLDGAFYPSQFSTHPMNGGHLVLGNLVSSFYLWGAVLPRPFWPPGTVWPRQYCLVGPLFQAILPPGSISVGGSLSWQNSSVCPTKGHINHKSLHFAFSPTGDSNSSLALHISLGAAIYCTFPTLQR